MTLPPACLVTIRELLAVPHDAFAFGTDSFVRVLGKFVRLNYVECVGDFEDVEPDGLPGETLSVKVDLTEFGALPVALGVTGQVIGRVGVSSERGLFVLAAFWRPMPLLDVRLYMAALRRVRQHCKTSRIGFLVPPAAVL